MLGAIRCFSPYTPLPPVNTNDKHHAYPTYQRPYLCTTNAIALRTPHWAGQDYSQGSPSCTSSTYSGYLGDAVPESPVYWIACTKQSGRASFRGVRLRPTCMSRGNEWIAAILRVLGTERRERWDLAGVLIAASEWTSSECRSPALLAVHMKPPRWRFVRFGTR